MTRGASMVLRTIRRHLGRQSVRHVYARQFYFSGVQSLALVLVAGAAIGAVLVHLVQQAFGQPGAMAMHILMLSVLHEIGPLLVALLFAMRSVSAMATEMAVMRVNGELATLDLWGISALEYLMLPRVLVAAVCCVLLYVYFSFAALLTGALVTQQSSLLSELSALARALPLKLLLLGGLKTAVFGAVVATLACRFGNQARAEMTEVPRLSSKAVLFGVIAIFVIDGVFVLPMAEGY